MFGGGSKEAYQEQLEARLDKHRRRQRKAALDQKIINSKALRAQRLAALKKLEEDGRDAQLVWFHASLISHTLHCNHIIKTVYGDPRQLLVSQTAQLLMKWGLQRGKRGS